MTTVFTKPSPYKVLSLCLLASMAVLLHIAHSTSPLYSDMSHGIDSSIFYLVGKEWTKGNLPYVDFWDLKGPYIYLVNALGYFLTSSRLGVFIIQVLNLTATLSIIYYWIFDFTRSIKQSVAFTTLTLFAFAMYYEGGNNVEEYGLPYLTLSFYGMYRWLKHWEGGQKRHSYLFAFIYGITFGICVATRTTNALGLCAGVAVIGFHLMFAGAWKNLFLNLGTFLLGAGIVIGGFILYFAAYDALGELWYGVIAYSLDYASTPINQVRGWRLLLSFVRPLTSHTILLVVLSVWVFFLKGKKTLAILGIAVSLPVFLWFVNSNGYAHYGIITVGTLPFLYQEILLLKKHYEEKLSPHIIKVLYILALLAVIKAPLHVLIGTRLYTHKEDNVIRSEVKYLRQQMPQYQDKNFIGYNNNGKIYLALDIAPCYRYFSLHEFQSKLSESYRQRVYDTFSTCKADYIFVKGKSTVIAPILQKHYTLKDKTHIADKEYFLYEKKGIQ